MKIIESIRGSLTISLLSLSCFIPAYADTGAERRAFDDAVNAVLKNATSGTLGDAEIVWAQSLKTLAQSEAIGSDTHLAQLGTFKLDGAFASEYTCAASKRNKRLSQLLRTQLKQFKDKNLCRQTASSKKLDFKALCATQQEFGTRVKTLQHLPLKDTEGACSY